LVWVVMGGRMALREAKGDRKASGRPRKRKPKRGDGPIPRSLAMTLEFIRQELVEGAPLTVEVLDREFRSERMRKLTPLKEDNRVEERAGTLGRRISAYENAERDVSFGTQRRYALVSGTRTGAIHFISLFYSFLRCAANPEHDADAREAELAEALVTATKLKAFAIAAEVMVRGAKSSGLLEKLREDAWLDPNERLIHSRAVMRPLFEAYRNG
jgi:hypothetical protein